MARGKAAEKGAILERQHKALDMRKRGWTYREIAAALGVDLSTAHKDVRNELRKLADMNSQSADELRQLELERLDKALNAIMHFVEAGSPQHVMAMLRICEQRAKLLGLYAPVKQDVTIDDVTQLSNHERVARITSILNSAREKVKQPDVLQ